MIGNGAKLEIKLTRLGQNCDVFVDGKPLEGVNKFTITAEVGKVTMIELTCNAIAADLPKTIKAIVMDEYDKSQDT